MAEILLSGGADIARRNCHGLTALHYANSDAKLLELLAKHAGKEVINMKADAGGYTALHCSVNHGARPVRVLLAHGADPGIMDWYGRTALHLAAGIGSMDAIKELLGHVDVGVQDHSGCTALHWAATWENWEVVRTLVEEGRSPLHLKSREGKTARDIAAEKRWMDGVGYLERMAAGSML
ncbi:ankyrin [Tuber magnatum]|uniref:Ankyrin n=1 Tax=Tuber magnatum TaxID=42249 RepID=A0A317SPF7_9PEZI|nr:ankyrin [Tuber magnatum]